MSHQLATLCDFTRAQVESLFSREGQPRYRVGQLFHWIYQKGVVDPQQMTNIGSAVCTLLEREKILPALFLKKVTDSKDGETTKFLWRLSDGKFVESVLIRSGNRRTVCISSQVGCAARCAFCASGQFGWMRNLSVGEIVEQVVRIRGILSPIGEDVSHLVFMGMGEPLDNFDAVISSIRVFTDEELGGFSPRRITLSTVGVLSSLERLVSEKLHVNLAFSLHAPNQHIRKKILPYARKTPLDLLLKACRLYAKVSKRNLTYEYILISGINDGIEHAKELASLVKGEPCCINLIPYNPVPGRSFKRPEKEQIEQFRKVLTRASIRHTCRYEKGKDIAAACGQLAMQEEEEKKPFPIGEKSV